MPRGGARPGAGRKPKEKGVVLGMNGNRLKSGPPELPPAITPAEREGLAEPPQGLNPEVQKCWRELAPTALAERTLVPSTESGFVELCLRMANVRALDAKVQLLGVASTEALPYLRERRGQAAQLASSLKDFKLTAFGKPVTADKPKAKDNPWGAFGGPAVGGK